MFQFDGRLTSNSIFGASGETGRMKPFTWQYSPSRFLGASAATRVAEATVAPVVGKPMAEAGTVMPAIFAQASAGAAAGWAEDDEWPMASTAVEDSTVTTHPCFISRSLVRALHDRVGGPLQEIALRKARRLDRTRSSTSSGPIRFSGGADIAAVRTPPSRRTLSWRAPPR